MANMQDVLLIPRHKPSWHKLSGKGGWEGGGVSELSAGSWRVHYSAVPNPDWIGFGSGIPTVSAPCQKDQQTKDAFA